MWHGRSPNTSFGAGGVGHKGLGSGASPMVPGSWQIPGMGKATPRYGPNQLPIENGMGLVDIARRKRGEPITSFGQGGMGGARGTMRTAVNPGNPRPISMGYPMASAPGGGGVARTAFAGSHYAGANIPTVSPNRAIVPWVDPNQAVGGSTSAGRTNWKGKIGGWGNTAKGWGNQAMDLGSKSFAFQGRNITYGRAGLTAGLGMLAVSNGLNMVDRMRYGDYGGAMMSGALAGAAGYGAYRSWMVKGSLRSHLGKQASKLLGSLR